MARRPHRPADAPLLVPGRNCWRIERAERVAFLVDGDEYFGAVRSALAQARHSIFILGWDIDSRMRLVPDGANDGLPEPLGDFLNAVVARSRELRGYVLSWDFAMLYAMEREWLPIYKLDWRTHRRLTFRLDDQHPIGASHHQKIIVVDDAVAFVSGYDLTRCRWDTSDARAATTRGASITAACRIRRSTTSASLVDGDCARALGELARERWQRATGEQPRRSRIADAAPRSVARQRRAPRSTDVDVAIARTEPAFDGRPGVTEIRRAAPRCDRGGAGGTCSRRTSISRRARSPRRSRGGCARGRRARDRRAVAVYAKRLARDFDDGRAARRAFIACCARPTDTRYRLYCPMLRWLDQRNGCLNVHSKVLIVDDALLMRRLGQSVRPLAGHRHRMQPRHRSARRSAHRAR